MHMGAGRLSAEVCTGVRLYLQTPCPPLRQHALIAVKSLYWTINTEERRYSRVSQKVKQWKVKPSLEGVSKTSTNSVHFCRICFHVAWCCCVCMEKHWDVDFNVCVSYKLCQFYIWGGLLLEHVWMHYSFNPPYLYVVVEMNKQMYNHLSCKILFYLKKKTDVILWLKWDHMHFVKIRSSLLSNQTEHKMELGSHVFCKGQEFIIIEVDWKQNGVP